MKYRQMNRKRFLLLSVVVFAICGIALGYAVLSQSIKINGTGTISTNWDILFTDIAEKSKKGATTNDSRITDKLTATFDVDLESPGSYIEYNVKIRNNGNMDAVIAKVVGIVEANSADPTGIQFKVSGIRIGDDLLAGSEKTFVVRAEIPASEGRLPTASKTLDLKVDVRQKEVDSSGLVTTLNECFQTNEAGNTITGYLCGKGNTNGYSEILDVNIPREINGKTITKIGDSAFSLKGLSNVIIPNSITTIGSMAFNQNSLRQLSLPNSVVTISEAAFRFNKLASIVIPDSVTKISTNAFSYNQLTEINIPAGVSLGRTVFLNNQMADDEAFIYNRNSDGTEDKTSINSYAGANRDHVVIPPQVETISGSSFSYCNIKQIDLPEHLMKIEYEAFSHNQLTTLTIPLNVESIGINAFESNQLTNVEFKGSVPATVHYNIFKNNSGLTSNTIKVPTGTVEQYRNTQGKYGNNLYSPSQTWFGSDNAGLLDAFYE